MLENKEGVEEEQFFLWKKPFKDFEMEASKNPNYCILVDLQHLIT